MSEDDLRKILFTNTEEDYPSYKNHLLEQYRIYVTITDENSNRRLDANKFFISLNAIMITLIGVILQIRNNIPKLIQGWILLVFILGMGINFVWKQMIESYSILNEGRFQIIWLLEERLPAEIFKSEWRYLKPPCKKSRYEEITNREKKIPIIFTAFYVILSSLSFLYIILIP